MRVMCFVFRFEGVNCKAMLVGRSVGGPLTLAASVFVDGAHVCLHVCCVCASVLRVTGQKDTCLGG